MKAAVYSRYSTDHQTENSIAYQMSALSEYCNVKNYSIDKVYSDEACTGTNDQRAGFQKMLAEARQKLFNVIVFYDVTRGSRDVADWFNFRKEMRILNIRVESVKNNLGDPLNSNDFLVELFSVGMGQMEVLSTRQRSRDGVHEKAKQGVFLGGTAPLGYDIADGKYIINEVEAAAVKKIFTMYADGDSYNNILDKLNGFKGKKGSLIGKNSLYNILKNERYIGVYSWNKRIVKIMRKWAGGIDNPNAVRIENLIPPIIETNIWEKVQKRMKENTKGRNGAKREYLLSGMIECSSCGAAYVGHTSRNGKGYESRCYTCGDKYRTRSCKNKNINADNIEVFVVSHLTDFLKSNDFSQIAKDVVREFNSLSADLTKEKKELSQINIKIQNGLKAILGGMDFPELEDELTKLRSRKAELENLIAAKSEKNLILDEQAILNQLTDSASNIAENPRIAIKNHIMKIYADADGSYTVSIGVHINGCGDRI